MKILITDKPHPILVGMLRQAGHEVVVDPTIDYDSLCAAAGQYDAWVVRSRIRVDRPLLDCAGRAGRLRCIGREGAGMETIDVAYAEGLGISCLNSPEGNRDAVGEHAVGLLLALFDKIASADAEVRRGLWRREENRGLEVKGKTVGIIGFGNMGRAFAQRLRGFECDIIAYDKYKPAGYAPEWVREVTLAELQARADVVSLHVPLTDETRYMVDSSFLHAFAGDIFLINTSRGAVVKTDDLLAALEEGKVRGAALDVLEYEDMTKDGLATARLAPLLSQRVVLTPHVAGWTVESKEKLARVLAEKIIHCLQLKIENLVSL